MTYDRLVVFSGYSGFLHKKTDHHDIADFFFFFRIEEEEQLDREISEGKLLKHDKKDCSIQ